MVRRGRIGGQLVRDTKATAYADQGEGKRGEKHPGNSLGPIRAREREERNTQQRLCPVRAMEREVRNTQATA